MFAGHHFAGFCRRVNNEWSGCRRVVAAALTVPKHAP